MVPCATGSPVTLIYSPTLWGGEREATLELGRVERERLILDSLLERRLAAEQELRDTRTHLGELSRRESELKDEIAILDGILGAVPAPAPAPSPLPPAPVGPYAPEASAPANRRRRAGTRRAQMLPRMREKLGTAAFAVDDVLDLLLAEEPGERRKVYFAAYSLVRDLMEDGVIAVATEEGAGARKRRTFRFG